MKIKQGIYGLMVLAMVASVPFAAGAASRNTVKKINITPSMKNQMIQMASKKLVPIKKPTGTRIQRNLIPVPRPVPIKEAME